MRSGQAPSHVTLGPESAAEMHTPGGPGGRSLGRGAAGGALRPRLGLAWPG